MEKTVTMPKLGMTMEEGTVLNWRYQVGEWVEKDEALVEVMTDKVNMEVSAEQGGVLQKIVKQEGDEVAAGDVLAMIGDSAAQGAAPDATKATKATEATEAADSQKTAVEQQPAREKVPAMAAPEANAPASPLARRVAAEYNVDLTQVKGNSAHGRVTRDDVMNFVEKVAQPPTVEQPAAGSSLAVAQPAVQAAPAAQAARAGLQAEAGRREERIRMSRRRQTIAQRLVEAQHTAAMLTTFNEIDMSAVMEVRSRRKESFKERHNVSLGFMSFFTKAVVGALKAFPRLNAEIQGNEMILKHYYDIGIAVGAEEGLVVPVLRDADRKSFAEIEREIADLAKRARDNSLTLADLQGGTFTITNGGVFGSLLSTPILNGPQVGILGMHKIEQRPVVVNGQVVVRPMMYVAVSYDHRIVDGREAVQFLVRVKELVEDPESLLLEG